VEIESVAGERERDLVVGDNTSGTPAERYSHNVYSRDPVAVEVAQGIRHNEHVIWRVALKLMI
jgi:hypothetical protein